MPLTGSSLIRRSSRKTSCLGGWVPARMIKKAPDRGDPDESGTSSHKYGVAVKFHVTKAYAENELNTDIRYSP
jgi:hypothetical protein